MTLIEIVSFKHTSQILGCAQNIKEDPERVSHAPKPTTNTNGQYVVPL